jgi:hypothetical protein
MGPMALLPLRRKCVLRIFNTHKNPPSSAGPEYATESTVGPAAGTLTVRSRAALGKEYEVKLRSKNVSELIVRNFSLLH